MTKMNFCIECPPERFLESSEEGGPQRREIFIFLVGGRGTQSHNLILVRRINYSFSEVKSSLDNWRGGGAVSSPLTRTF